MSGILATTKRKTTSAFSGELDTTSFTAEDVDSPTSIASATFNTNGSATLYGSNSTSPASPRWWTTGFPPPTWMSYTSTGTGSVLGGLVSGTRYQLNTARTLGMSTTAPSASRTFTITFYDADSGGTTLGTKTFTTTAITA